MNSLVRSTATFQEQDLERSISQNFVPCSCAPRRLTQDHLLLHFASTSFLRSLFAHLCLTLHVGTFSRFPSEQVLFDTFLLKVHCIAAVLVSKPPTQRHHTHALPSVSRIESVFVEKLLHTNAREEKAAKNRATNDRTFKLTTTKLNKAYHKEYDTSYDARKKKSAK